MPLVHVYWNSWKVTGTDIRRIENALPDLVSNALSVSTDSSFPPSEVTVKGFEMEKLTDKHTERDDDLREPMSHDIEVVVWAHNYPERERSLEQLAATMASGVQKLAPEHCSGYVWLLLQPSAFTSFQPR